MTSPKTALLHRAKSFRLGAAILLTTLILFAAATTAPAQTFTKLYDFGASPGDPANPFEELFAQGRDANLYSTTRDGGTYGLGTVFRVTPSGIVTVVYNFDGTHGATPFGGLTLGTDGNFYGTTFFGGSGQCLGFGGGTVFKITPDGDLSTLHNFGDDGCLPYVAPIEATDGNFYGTTGHDSYGNHGMVYKMTPSGNVKVLHQFGGYEVGEGLLQATDGNLYGNAQTALYEITPGGQFTYLYSFTDALGVSLVQGTDGPLYGTACCGREVIYRVTSAGSYSVLHQFRRRDGIRPIAAMFQATDGNFYGVAETDGTAGAGTIYAIGRNRAFSVFYNFDNATGSQPDTPLVQHTNGILYGDASAGGAYGYGTFFSLDLGLPPFARLVSTSGQIGKNIGVLGQGFTGTSSVSFNGIPATFNVASDTYLEAYVPDGALTGSVAVTTPTGTLTSNTIFRVTPKVLSFNPTSGGVGTPVVITGTGLTQTLRVGFGGVAATSFTIDSDTQVTAIVPDGAVTGKIAIATQGGHDTGTQVFTVTP
ncbi:MAG TPA: choice-of-anchor tandem repeat GloVer-containing protein [Terriglobales bacterium]|jgi:uncharacterized repeat protein (TIGR03803 family)|nr:choice-of-anchor tandem repeat GloVer-containing protein [Terriglobales bacterium]